MKKNLWFLLLLLFPITYISAQPVKPFPGNTHYLMYKGQPVLLITSDHHYGAVVNSEFDYEAFLKKMNSAGMNFTRIYPGAYIEQEGAFMAGNVLGVRDGKQILPWQKTSITGAHKVLGGYKYDLDKWNEDYFKRLKDFCLKAKSMDIIVEICFFNGEYNPEWGKGGWPIEAMNINNNVNNAGKCSWDKVNTISADEKLIEYQEKYVQEITKRLNDFDNVIFHIADEPWMGDKNPDSYGPWVGRMIDAFWSVENKMPKRHILGQTVDYFMRDNAADFSADKRIQYIDMEYVRGTKDLRNEYEHKKPLILIETGYYPVFYKGDKRMEACRVEAWEFMTAGSAGFMNLNGLYSTDNETGEGTEIDRFLDMFVKLADFMNDFDFKSMKQDNELVAGKIPDGAFISSISEPGRQYAFYVHHSDHEKSEHPNVYIVKPGSYKETFTFRIPKGSYTAEWIDPVSGSVLSTEKIKNKGSEISLTTPTYSIDIAMKIKSSKAKTK